MLQRVQIHIFFLAKHTTPDNYDFAFLSDELVLWITLYRNNILSIVHARKEAELSTNWMPDYDRCSRPDSNYHMAFRPTRTISPTLTRDPAT